MPKLPALSGKEVVKALRKLSYEVDHQTGSHLILRQSTEYHRRLTVPNHKEISKGTLRAIIRQAGLTRDEFISLLD
jgi:predicted RNA binding protein YcfA (HicA-like mRNA interferase family)